MQINLQFRLSFPISVYLAFWQRREKHHQRLNFHRLEVGCSRARTLKLSMTQLFSSNFSFLATQTINSNTDDMCGRRLMMDLIAYSLFTSRVFFPQVPTLTRPCRSGCLSRAKFHHCVPCCTLWRKVAVLLLVRPCCMGKF